jgi:pyruvate formate lyase activating enzyme
MIRLLNIQRMSSEDGPGLRTTAFLKGCPLNCSWCHNPESISPKGEVLWHRARCIACESCAEVCPQHGIALAPERLTIERNDCLACFSCVRSCPTGAVEAKGTPFEVDALCGELLKDRAYFGDDGGVTLSGGEALLQAESVDLLKMLKEAGVGTAVDTCGHVKPERLRAALPFADIVLYDLKLASNDEHKRWTGVGNQLILENLRVVAEWATSDGGRLWIRTPIIPGATDSIENIREIAALLASLPDAPEAIERWELCAFNNLCASKYDSIERTWDHADTPLIPTTHMQELVATAQAGAACADIRATGATEDG